MQVTTPNPGKDANYTLYDVSGWGPDYGDPATLPRHPCSVTAQVTWLSASVSSNTAFAQ